MSLAIHSRVSSSGSNNIILSLYHSILKACRHPVLDTKAKAKIILRILANPRHVARMERTLDELGLSFVSNQHPRMLEKPARPYLASGLQKAAITTLFCAHYKALTCYFNKTVIESIYTTRQILFSSFLSEMEVELVLHYDQAMEKEGEITLSLMFKGKSIYSAALLFHSDTIYIGALQGSKSALNEIRQFTKTCHGLRPQNFLVFVIRTMAQHFGVSTIMAVSNGAHIYSSKKRTKDRVRFDYDSFWCETGGSVASPIFFDLPLEQPRKAPSSIAMNKRAAYRRRYEFLDTCAAELGSELNKLRWHTPLR